MGQGTHPPGPEGGSHYFDAAPSASSRPGRVALRLPGATADLETDSGVFSPSRLDPGTAVLLDAIGPDGPAAERRRRLPEGDLVDLGAGYGPLAVALALWEPGRRVWAVEVNDRAAELCRRNAASAGVGDRVEVVGPEGVPDRVDVAGIVSNPPIRIGKAALHDLLSGWLGRLDPRGAAWLVVQRHLGADSLASWLRAGGRDVERVRSRRGYRVLEVTAGGPGPPGAADGPAGG